MPDPIRIVVCDDHPIVREGLVAILSTQPDFEVIAEASNGIEGVRAVTESRPDVVMLDLEMPGLDGVEVLRELERIGVEAKAIVFTVFDSDERIVSAVQAGAQGYLLKGAPREEIFNAIRIVAAGGSLLQPVIASKLMRHVSAGPVDTSDRLTDREIEVLRLLSLGRTNREIGEQLFISERTVKFHVSSILSKLDASNRTEAVSRAVAQGLIEMK